MKMRQKELRASNSQAASLEEIAQYLRNTQSVQSETTEDDFTPMEDSLEGDSFKFDHLIPNF